MIIVGAPLVIRPDKVAERPACKIKSVMVIRILGVVVMILGIISLLPL